MRRTLGHVPLALCLVALLSVGTWTDAGIRPSFDLDGCTWYATHVVSVQTTENDTVFTVLESWKGDLKHGDSVEIPELKPQGNAVPISRLPKSSIYSRDDQYGVSEQIPRQPANSQMILFLRKLDEASGPSTKWEPSSRWGGMKVSALWIDAGKAYCFQQWMNPGPSALSPCARWPLRSSDIGAFTARLQEVLQVQRELTDALALKDVNLRAQRVGFVAISNVLEAQNEAIATLGKIGEVAVPEILRVMDAPPARDEQEMVIQSLVQATGKDSGKYLHARLQQDVIYWKTVAPTLTEDWLGQLIVVGSPLQVKFRETSLLIRELDRERYVHAERTVTELRDFWVSQPQLYDSRWGRDGRNGEARSSVTGQDIVRAYAFGMGQDCDDFLKHVRGLGPSQ